MIIVRYSLAARLAAALVMLVILAALGIQLADSMAKTGTPEAALWTMARFFTIIGNLYAWLIFLRIALTGHAPPSRLGGATLTLLLIGIVYVTLLRGTLILTPLGLIADTLLHYVSPVVVTLYWLIFAHKGRLTRLDPLRWALLPLAYFPYAILRAQADGIYPYPFLNVAKLGWPMVLTTAAIIAAGFLVAGLLLVTLDRLLRQMRT